ncbi:hypothetical protein Tco_0245624 [Tanacetum coccineum]
MELGTNWVTLNLVNKGDNSTKSSFWNVDNSTSTTPIIDKTRKYENLIIDGQATLVDKAGNPLKTGRVSGDSYENGDFDDHPYDDDMYEGQDLSKEIQTICDNVDIRVRGHKKK